MPVVSSPGRSGRLVTAVVAALTMLLLGLVPPAAASGTGSISGRVTDAAGNPLAGVTAVTWVAAEDLAERRSTTGANGRYTLPGLPAGLYTVCFYTEGTSWAPECYDDVWYGDQHTITVGTAQAVAGINAVLARGATLSGVLRDGRGYLLEGVYVDVMSADGNHMGSAKTDARGRWAIASLRAGDLVVRFHHPGWETEFHPGVLAPPYGEIPDAATRFRVVAGQLVTGVDGRLDVLDPDSTFPRPPFTQVVASKSIAGTGLSDLVTVDSVGRLHLFRVRGADVQLERSYGLGWADLQVVAPGDWDGDQYADLMAVTPDGSLYLYRGHGNAGNLSARVPIGHGWTGLRVVGPGDVTGDHVADLLAVDTAGRLWLYPNNRSGGFGRRVQVGQGWSGFRVHAAGDATRDERADLYGVDGAGRLFLYPGTGGGTFGRRVQVGSGWAGTLLASGHDHHLDDIPDLFGRRPNGELRYYPGLRTGGFGPSTVAEVGW